LDTFIAESFAEFGYQLPFQVSAHIATRTLTYMSDPMAREYVTDRLSELSGQPQQRVVRYVLQDASEWLKDRQTPKRMPSKKREREVYRDGFVPPKSPTTEQEIYDMFDGKDT
jgi:hypothetical protein